MNTQKVDVIHGIVNLFQPTSDETFRKYALEYGYEKGVYWVRKDTEHYFGPR
jgi:hypothetical protein